MIKKIKIKRKRIKRRKKPVQKIEIPKDIPFDRILPYPIDVNTPQVRI